MILNRYLRDDSSLLLGRLETRDTGFHRDVYATDRLGSIAALYRIDGTAPVRMQTFEYAGLNPFGYTGYLTDPQSVPASSNEPFSHSGRWTDAQTSLQWDGSRWLDPFEIGGRNRPAGGDSAGSERRDDFDCGILAEYSAGTRHLGADAAMVVEQLLAAVYEEIVVAGRERIE